MSQVLAAKDQWFVIHVLSGQENKVRDNIVKRVEGITGLSVTEVNVSVNDLHFPGDDRAPAEEPRVS